LPSLAVNPSLQSWTQVENPEQNAMITPDFANDLHLFTGDPSAAHEDLLLRLRKTQTFFGDVFFERLFQKPSRDLQVLQTRQALIQKLVSDDELYTKFRTALDHLQSSQIKLINFINTSVHEELRNSQLLLYPQGTKQMEVFEKIASLTDAAGMKNFLALANRNPFFIAAAPALKLATAGLAIWIPLNYILNGDRGIINQVGLAKANTPGGSIISNLYKGCRQSFELRGERIAQTTSGGLKDLKLGNTEIGKFLLFIPMGIGALAFILPNASAIAGLVGAGEGLFDSGIGAKGLYSNLKKSKECYLNMCKTLAALKHKKH
jgi:hypothetical protein